MCVCVCVRVCVCVGVSHNIMNGGNTVLLSNTDRRAKNSVVMPHLQKVSSEKLHHYIHTSLNG